MDATVNLLDNEFGYSDKESDASSSYSTQVSSTVSDVLIGLNIESPAEAIALTQQSSSEVDEDVLSVCANEEDTKFVEENLSAANRVTQSTVYNSKKRRKGDETTLESKRRKESAQIHTRQSSVEQSGQAKYKTNRKRPNRLHSQPVTKNPYKMSENKLRPTKSLPLPNEMLQMSEITSTKNDFIDTKRPKMSYRFSDVFESDENKMIAKIFGNPCLKYLSGKCDDEKCIYGHELPDPNVLRMRLTELDVDQVRIALKTHARLFNRLLERYFRSFTEYFSKNGYRADLLEMISICQDPTVEMQSNYVHIMDGLVQLGMLYWGALNLVLNYHTNFTEKSMFVLTTLITDKRNNNISQYLANLKNFYKMHFQFNPIIIDRLMQICLDMPYDAKWFEFVRKVVNDCSSMDGLNLDLLAGFCTMTPGKYDLIRKSRSNLN